MKEKNIKDNFQDNLLHYWEEGLLPHHKDDEVTEQLLSFVEDESYTINDDSDIREMLKMHIHTLAQEENISRQRLHRRISWISAAACVCIIALVSVALNLKNHSVDDNAKDMIALNDIVIDALLQNHFPADIPLDIQDTTIYISDISLVPEKQPTKPKTRKKHIQSPPIQPQNAEYAQTEDITEEQLLASEELLREVLNEITSDIKLDGKELAMAFEEIDINIGNFIDCSFDEHYDQSEPFQDEASEFYDYQIIETPDHTTNTRSVFENNLIDAFHAMKKINVSINFE